MAIPTRLQLRRHLVSHPGRCRQLNRHPRRLPPAAQETIGAHFHSWRISYQVGTQMNITQGRPHYVGQPKEEFLGSKIPPTPQGKLITNLKCIPLFCQPSFDLWVYQKVRQASQSPVEPCGISQTYHSVLNDIEQYRRNDWYWYLVWSLKVTFWVVKTFFD